MPIAYNNVSFVYSAGSPFESAALRGIDCAIEPGSFLALVGRTGSGKSTMVQLLNALLVPSEGEVVVDEYVNSPDKKRRTKKLKGLRKKVGYVFQFPEYQLFLDTVEKDVAYGPRNFGASPEEALKKAHEALLKVGLDSSFYERSPFALSGGEKRKVAMAGILAMEPDVLVLDEPTAGLDPEASREMIALFKEINAQGTTIVLVSHDMDLVLECASRLIVLENGKIVKDGDPSSLFEVNLESYALEEPKVFAFVDTLKKLGLSISPDGINSVDSLADKIKEALK